MKGIEPVNRVHEKARPTISFEQVSTFSMSIQITEKTSIWGPVILDQKRSRKVIVDKRKK